MKGGVDEVSSVIGGPWSVDASGVTSLWVHDLDDLDQMMIR